MALSPQELGSFTTGASMSAPTSNTDGYACNGARYVNVWAQASGTGTAIKYYLYVYLYRTGIGWVRYLDLPPVLNVWSPVNGLLAEIEVRGAERIYARRVGSTAPNFGTATVMLEGFTYR